MQNSEKTDRVLSCLLAMYITLLPFEQALSSNLGSIVKLVGILIIVYSLMRYMKIENKIYALHIYLGLWLFLAFLSVLWANSIIWWSYFFKFYIGQIILFFSLSLVPVGRVDLKYLRMGMIMGAVSATMVLLVSPNMGGQDEARKTILLFDKGIDENILSAEISLGILTLLRYFDHDVEKKRSVIISITSLLLLLFMFIGVYLTGSRGSLIAIIAGLIIFVIIGFWRKSNFKKTKYYVALVVVVVAFVLVYFQDIILQASFFNIDSNSKSLLETRFSGGEIFGQKEMYLEGNRYSIWKNSIDFFVDSPIIGYGCGNFLDVSGDSFMEQASHNMYILLLIEYGIIGFLLFMTPIVWTIRKLLFFEEDLTLGLFVCVLITCLSLDGMTYKYFWVAWLYSFNVIRQADDKTPN